MSFAEYQINLIIYATVGNIVPASGFLLHGSGVRVKVGLPDGTVQTVEKDVLSDSLVHSGKSQIFIVAFKMSAWQRTFSELRENALPKILILAFQIILLCVLYLRFYGTYFHKFLFSLWQ